jgi:molecular chaperone GrpE
MRNKKHEQDQEPQPAEEDAAEILDAAGRPEAELREELSPEILNQRLEQAQADAAENLDGWQRALAEFQNYKKRVERDRILDQTSMKSDLIRKVLPIMDDLERALQNGPEDNAWANGIELIRRKLQGLLEAEGVQRIEAEGAIFDPNLHEAISQEPVDGVESGRIVAVTLQGYMLADRVIRPAQVRVAA